MIADFPKIVGKRIFLQPLNENNVSRDYLRWMNDRDIIQYLTSRDGGYNKEELSTYVAQMNGSPDNYLFGIFLKEGDLHIGNIKIGGINSIHKFGDVGLVIGDKNETGKGYATEAIELVTRFAFDHLKLNKLLAGMISENIGSYKAFVKAGYEEAGRLKMHVLFRGTFSDTILMEKCNDGAVEHNAQRTTVGQKN